MSQIRPVSVLANPYSSCHISSQSNATELSFRSCKTHTSPTNHLQNLNLRNSEASPLIVMHQNRNSLTGTNSDSVTEFPSPCHSLIYHSTCTVGSFWTGCSAFFGQWLGPGSVPRARLQRRTRHAPELGQLEAGGANWSGDRWPPAWGKDNAGKRRSDAARKNPWDLARTQYMRWAWKNELGFGMQRKERIWHKNNGICKVLWLH